MKCGVCEKELEIIEICELRGNYCCGEFHVSNDSLRPKVRELRKEVEAKKEMEFWIKLEKAVNCVKY